MTYRVKNLKEFLYLIAITGYLSAMILTLTVFRTNSAFTNILTYVRYFTYLLIAIKILMDLFDAKSIWRICIIFILVAITILNVQGNTYFFYIFVIIGAKDVNLRKIIRQATYVLGICLAGTVCASQLGLIENYLYLQAGRNRYGLGFIYTTTAPILFFFFMMCYIYLRKERMRIYEFAILEAINYWFFIQTNTRFSFYLSTIMLIYVFLMRYYWQNRKGKIRKNWWLMLAPSGCCIGGILLHVCYNSETPAWIAMNELLNNRLTLGHEALGTYGITLFGQQIKWVGGSKLSVGLEYNYVDCSYMQLLLECGIIFLIIVIALYTYMMYIAIKTKDFYLQTIVLVIVIFSILEPRLMNLAFNPFPLLSAAAWSIRKPEELNIKEPFSIPRVKLQATRIKLKGRC